MIKLSQWIVSSFLVLLLSFSAIQIKSVLADSLTCPEDMIYIQGGSFKMGSDQEYKGQSAVFWVCYIILVCTFLTKKHTQSLDE